MWYTVCKEFTFEMAHRLSLAYTRKCTDTIHGHTFVLQVFLRTRKLNVDGMVMDFGLIKKYVQEIVLDKLDHSLLLPEDTTPLSLMEHLMKNNARVRFVSYNPTSEQVAKDLFERLKEKIPELFKVRLYEGPGSFAEVEE